MADSQRKFDAAVHVIRSLPKSGSFQPSHEMMLKFYGYYKQAKEGPCNEAKPSFWDVVKKAKWEAWSNLGDISKEEAMENYVAELKEVIRNMPETDQASQFITALEPFYKAAYKETEKAPPIFNIFTKKQHSTPSIKMNGHVPQYVKENGTSHEQKLNTSHASAIHNITADTTITHSARGQSNGDIQMTGILSNGEVNGLKNGPSNEDVTHLAASNHVVLNGPSDVNENNQESNGDRNGNEDDDEDDDDDLFCDSLGPELLEEQVGRKQMLDSGMLESVPEDARPLNDRHLSSFSDVEILEQFDLKKNGGSGEKTSSSDKMVHVHFEDLNSSQDESTSTQQEIAKEQGNRECVVQPKHHGAGSGAGDSRASSRATGSDRKQSQRNVPYTERSSRYEQRYRRSQESDSDESPGRSDHNSSSERDDIGIDRIADLLIEIQDNMKKILDRLKRLETSLQRSQSTWFENYRPSKTFIFLVLWPIVVNFLFKFLRRRFSKER